LIFVEIAAPQRALCRFSLAIARFVLCGCIERANHRSDAARHPASDFHISEISTSKNSPRLIDSRAGPGYKCVVKAFQPSELKRRGE